MQQDSGSNSTQDHFLRGRKDEDDWASGEKDMTRKQEAFLQDLCEKTGETFDVSLSKAEASKRIKELQQKLRKQKQGIE